MISVLCVSDCLIDFRLLAGFDHAGEADRLELYWEPSMKNLVLSAFLGGLICAGGFPSSSAIAQGASLADGGQQRQAETDRLVGTWSLTDNNNVLFNLVLNADGTSLTVIGQRHPQEGTPQRLHRDQLVEQGRWSRWGNGIRSDYPSGWVDTIQVGPAGPVQWSWAPGADLNASPSNHGKAVRLQGAVMRWVGAYKLQPTQTYKPPYIAVLTSSGLAFNDIDHIADGSWTVQDDGSVMIKWTSGWRTSLLGSAPDTGSRFSVLHWRPGTSVSAPPSAKREGERL